VGNTAGSDIIISEDKIRGYRNFTTKIWNIARFILGNTPIDLEKISDIKYTPQDKKNLKEFKNLKIKVTKYLENYKFHHAGEAIYHYLWHTFADTIIEESKDRMDSTHSTSSGQASSSQEDKAAVQSMLIEIFVGSIKLLHPFMPFITEEIYQKFPVLNKKEFLMIEKW
jgi:valyl-tRNA synthetase